jgi:hypothetical protein
MAEGSIRVIENPRHSAARTLQPFSLRADFRGPPNRVDQLEFASGKPSHARRFGVMRKP